MNIRDILARYGVKPGTLPLEGDATPLAECLGDVMEGTYCEGYEKGAKDRMTAREAAELAPKDIRLDPDTLLWVATQMARGRLVSGDIPQALGALATRERDRVPDLADWVAAAVRSRLGAPHGYDAEDVGYGFSWDPRTGRGVDAEVLIEPLETGEWSAVVWHSTLPGGGHVLFVTPSKLRDALDALADGATP